MEPKLTCLDEATYLDNFHAEGHSGRGYHLLLSLQKSAASRWRARISHRVTMEVKGGRRSPASSGPREITTAGQTVAGFPRSNVNGYIIEVRTRMFFADTAERRSQGDIYNGVTRESIDKAIDAYRNYCRRHTLSPRHMHCSRRALTISRAGVTSSERQDDLWERLEMLERDHGRVAATLTSWETC